MEKQLFEAAAEAIKKSKSTTAFTGAGISVESGIPPFRGKDGLWSKYDMKTLELDFFHQNPQESWSVIKEIFYDYYGKANPNRAHYVLAKMEEAGLLKSIITQNIDNLHYEAGNKTVYEFHGNMKKLVCTGCHNHFTVDNIDFEKLPPRCESCGGLIKPDFIFFGEGIPQGAYANSFQDASNCDVMLVIGTTGEIMPASQLPYLAKQNGATIIEVNKEPSKYTGSLTDIFLQGKATEVMGGLGEMLGALDGS